MEGSVAARKVMKADREKMRRDRLNERFVELGNVLDSGRCKNDKGVILTDTIQLLKDLNAQVEKLKTEYSALSEESSELTQEKNDLREEKNCLKFEIENLNAQYQMRLRAAFPWGAMDNSVMMAPYPYPVPMQLPMPVHPPMQSYPFYGNPNPGAAPSLFSAFMPHMPTNASMEQHSTWNAPPAMQLATRSHVSSQKDCKHTSTIDSRNERSEDSNDVAQDLELKTPGSKSDQGSVSVHRKSKKGTMDGNNILGKSSPSRCSSQSEHSSRNSVSGGAQPDTDATTHIQSS